MLWQIHQFCKYETKSKLISSNSRLASEIHAGMFTYEHRETFHLLPSWVIEVKWWFLKGYGLDFFFLMWFWNDWWSVSLFGEQSQMRFSFICLKCPSYKYSLLYFALNNSKPLLLSEAPSGNFVFLFNSKILKKETFKAECGRKTKNKILEMAVKAAESCEDFLSQQQIVLLSWSSPKAEQSWVDGHWGGEIKLQGRSEKQPAGRCGRAHSELLKWPVNS